MTSRSPRPQERRRSALPLTIFRSSSARPVNFGATFSGSAARSFSTCSGEAQGTLTYRVVAHPESASRASKASVFFIANPLAECKHFVLVRGVAEIGLREQIFAALGGLRDRMSDADVAAVQRFAKMLPVGDLSVYDKAQLRSMEWAGVAACAPAYMGGPTGYWADCCPVCRGIKNKNAGFIDEAVGHRPDCRLAAALA